MSSMIPANLGQVTVRHLQEADHAAYVRLERDAEVKLYVNGPSPKTEEELFNDLRAYRPSLSVLAIAEASTEIFVGRCGLLSRENENEAEVFCLLAKSYWRKGIGEIIVSFLARLASENGQVALGVIDPGNQASLSLVRKLGWIPSGVIMQPGKQNGHLRYLPPSA